MNTIFCRPIASGTYNCWRVKFVLKKKHDHNINTTQAMAELYTTRLGGSHFIQSRLLLFKKNASLKLSVLSIPCLSGLSVCQSVRLTDSDVRYLGQD